jgi:hypothetical protein
VAKDAASWPTHALPGVISRPTLTIADRRFAGGQQLKKGAVMPTIKVHLERAEFDAVARLASSLGVKPEAIAYSALNRLMLTSRQADVQQDVVETWAWHRENLPLWSDSACSIHAYEGKSDDEPEPSKYC